MPGFRQPTSGDMGMVFQGNSQAQLSVSGTAAQTSAFTRGGYYDLWCDIDVFIKVGEVANNVTTSNGYLLRANTTLPNVFIRKDDKLGGISASSGTLRYHRVS